MGCNQNAGSSHGHINSEQAGGYADVNVEHVICRFFGTCLCAFAEWYHMSQRHFLAKEKTATLNLGVP